MTTVSTTDAQLDKKEIMMEAGIDPMSQLAGYLSLFHGALWAFMLFRWVTFGSINWTAFASELALSQWPPVMAYLIYGVFLVVDLVVGVGLLRKVAAARKLGIGRSVAVIIFAVAYFWLTREFVGAMVIVGLAGMLLILEMRYAAWSIAYPAGFWLGVFFVAPMLIVLVVSLGERSRLGTVTYPAFSLSNIGGYFDDYVRFFSRVGGEFIYLRIFWRSVWLATFNMLACLLIAYPFAYWIARQEERYRNSLVFLVMIPFWTNFLVRTYAWMLLLRDSGLINNFWTITLHEQAVALSGNSAFFAWLAEITDHTLPLLFNQPAVMVGLLYGYFPLMVLPLYSNLEKLDWSLLEAAADLGANAWHSTLRILLPLSMPGIVAGSIIVFIPSLGAYVTPDLLGGAKVALLGNLLQQQFMTVRDWPFGSAIGFIMLFIMLMATLLYFRTLNQSETAV
ncbi:MAG: ABC transporter permease [Anaerolineales bacterium]|nr:ABC transporter permease [Anaerolineales bacterium]